MSTSKTQLETGDKKEVETAIDAELKGIEHCILIELHSPIDSLALYVVSVYCTLAVCVLLNLCPDLVLFTVDRISNSQSVQ